MRACVHVLARSCVRACVRARARALVRLQMPFRLLINRRPKDELFLPPSPFLFIYLLNFPERPESLDILINKIF